ncbi:mitogen-activated protein kinase phosphatase 1 [Plasmodium gonderi]|uniref:Mitogen-activated protein kinase phosphatase 1 n=1 Tax=Plasmodium gonderi TaxID=77519 RepID=A0A1Y1JS26_PLAGO|nr:mitogen-activated protein kinase phosphatase 1 [Plasmodium gonderi]GAW83263.1 mitogen-activated protein kinase phosphatase 1 [Plasmodium gonderi]
MYESIDFEALKRDVRRKVLGCEGEKKAEVRIRDTERNEEKNKEKNSTQNEVIKNSKDHLREDPEGSRMKVITPFYLYNYMQLLLDEGKDKNMLIVDVRPKELFQRSHIRSAIHIHKAEGIKEMKNEIESKERFKIVFYDNGSDEHVCSYEYFLNSHFSNVKTSFYFLKGGYKNFENEYFFLCVKENSNDGNKISSLAFSPYINYPIKICNNIYMGNFIHINNSYVNKYLNIKYIYDFTSSGFEIKNVEEINYFRYNVLKKIVENQNAQKKESLNYYNFLDIRMVYDVIYSILQNTRMEKNYISGDEKNILNGKENSQKKIENEKSAIKELNYCVERKELHISKQEQNLMKRNIEKSNVLIICNQGIKNQTREKINSVSLIISMCYLMYTKRYNLDLVIVYMLKIYNNLIISSQTRTLLQNFHNSLTKCDYNIEMFYTNARNGKQIKKNTTTTTMTDSTNITANIRSSSSLMVGREKNFILKIVQDDNFEKFMKGFQLDNSYIKLHKSKEYILHQDTEHILENIHIMNEMVNRKEYISYEHIIKSILIHIYNNKNDKINIHEIHDLLKIVNKILNDSNVQNACIIPYFSLILLNLCKLLSAQEQSEEQQMSYHEGNGEMSLYIEEKENLKYNLFSFLCDNIIVCMHYIINNSTTNNSHPKNIVEEEYKVTLNVKVNYFNERNIDKNCYMMYLSLKYLLITFLHFYICPTIKKLKSSYIDKICYLLPQIDKFSEYYYSVFNVNINSFQKENYVAQLCSHDYLPLHFSDILRPFIIINNYLN